MSIHRFPLEPRSMAAFLTLQDPAIIQAGRATHATQLRQLPTNYAHPSLYPTDPIYEIGVSGRIVGYLLYPQSPRCCVDLSADIDVYTADALRYLYLVASIEAGLMAWDDTINAMRTRFLTEAKVNASARSEALFGAL
jgi:hypothetical protein